MRIVSLSRVWNSTLMWSHYADSHKGVVLSIEIYEPTLEAHPMNYVSRLASPNTWEPIERARALLLQKHEFWSYEKEYRVIIKNKSYVSVKIKEITLGLEVDRRLHNLVIDFAHTVDPELPVTKILKRGLDVVGESRWI